MFNDWHEGAFRVIQLRNCFVDLGLVVGHHLLKLENLFPRLCPQHLASEQTIASISATALGSTVKGPVHYQCFQRWLEVNTYGCFRQESNHRLLILLDLILPYKGTRLLSLNLGEVSDAFLVFHCTHTRLPSQQ